MSPPLSFPFEQSKRDVPMVFFWEAREKNQEGYVLKIAITDPCLQGFRWSEDFHNRSEIGETWGTCACLIYRKRPRENKVITRISSCREQCR